MTRVSVGRYELEILAATLEDAGEWRAIGTTRAGRCESVCELQINETAAPVEPPRFVVALADTLVSSGGSLQLTVTLRGTPQPTIEWRHDGHQLVHGDDGGVRIVDHERSSTLICLQIEPSCTGRYEVEARSVAGVVTSDCVVTVDGESMMTQHTRCDEYMLQRHRMTRSRLATHRLPSCVCHFCQYASCPKVPRFDSSAQLLAPHIYNGLR